jgi:hypothetical protein
MKAVLAFLYSHLKAIKRPPGLMSPSDGKIANKKRHTPYACEKIY